MIAENYLYTHVIKSLEVCVKVKLGYYLFASSLVGASPARAKVGVVMFYPWDSAKLLVYR
ncbi:hypothetical protein COCCADRAFT_101291 [Bipolaris zeicola 26-R-13]|uniref:Uncharacterized protein n=1 Tax=Cochliobolus carbonum (strain 26-R-13) TaxID=930089 RepID=W6XVG4_COCC2|nr:uncharacterized protein COCCADRAFT_101291 [Bipolaris zeicola 26-R-13]EUC31437.1 hypothetical protein COCCADRAFT_101291 [Bipolaris zeicola 26-R-13]